MTAFLFILFFLLLIAGGIFLYYVKKPIPRQQNATEKLAHFTSPDVDAPALQNALHRKKTADFIETAKLDKEAATLLVDLHNQYRAAVIMDTKADLVLQNELLRSENEHTILQKANQLGVPVDDYTKVMMEVLKSKTELIKEEMSLKMAIDLAIAHSDRHFSFANSLEDKILQLRLKLHALPSKELPRSVLEIEMNSLKKRISNLEAQLNEHDKQTGVSEVDGQEN